MRNLILGIAIGFITGLIVYDWLSTRLVLKRARDDAKDYEQHHQYVDKVFEKELDDDLNEAELKKK